VVDTASLRTQLASLASRAAAIDALAQRADALALLSGWLHDFRGGVRAAAAFALGQPALRGVIGSGEPTIDELDRVVRQDVFGVVAYRASESARMIRAALGRSGGPAPRPTSEWVWRAVNDLARDDLRAEADAVLAELGEDALVAWLLSDTADRKTAALLGHERSSATLIRYALAHPSEARRVETRLASDPAALTALAAPTVPAAQRVVLARHLESTPGGAARSLLETLASSDDASVVARASAALMARGERVPRLAHTPRAPGPRRMWTRLELATWRALLGALPCDAFAPPLPDEVTAERDLRALPAEPGWTHDILTERWSRGRATLTAVTETESHPHAGGGSKVEVVITLPTGATVREGATGTEIVVEGPAANDAERLIDSVLDELGWISAARS